MEAIFRNFLETYQEYAYFIIFVWCILEGELALILGGILAYEGHVHLAGIIFVAGIGAFVGDQIYFFIGRHNKKYIQKKLKKQRRKFAVAHLLLQRYGWPIIFIQRYMYGFRTIIPMSIGVTRYNAKTFAIINLLSAWVWAAITIMLAWHFGKEIWVIVDYAHKYWYFALPVFALFIGLLLFGFRQMEKNILKKRRLK